MMQTNQYGSSGNASLPNTTSLAAESNRVSPILMIIGAWMAGVLMLQLSSLDGLGSRSTGEHWGRQASILQRWDGRETELAVLQSNLAGLEGVTAVTPESMVLALEQQAGETIVAASPAQVVVAGAPVEHGSGREQVQLSSHQRAAGKPRRRGLQLPMLYLQPAKTESK